MKLSFLFSVAALLPVFAIGCAATGDDATNADEDEYTSASARLLDLELDGEVLSSSGDPEQTIKDQMLFTIGQLNGKVGVGRLDKLTLTNIQSSQQDGLTRTTYHAKLPVSLAKTSRIGRTYTLILPKRADWTGQESFYSKYGATGCTDYGAHDLETGIYWYYYRPEQAGCTLASTDVVRAKATVRKSPESSTNKYPCLLYTSPSPRDS